MSNIRASIDIGSNSILLLAAQLDNEFKILANESYVTGLGKGLDKTGQFASDTMAESLVVLKKYTEICNDLGIKTQHIIATATEASRVANNSADFYQQVLDETGLKVTVITGEGEAYYSSVGILFNTKFDSDVIQIMDIGGASTEIISVDVTSKKILKSFSMPFGAVRATNWIEEGILDIKIDEIYKNFKNDLNGMNTQQLYCVAGTMTSIANIHLNHKEFIEYEVHGHSFKTNDVFKMLNLYKGKSPQLLLEKFPFLGKRSLTIYGGMIVATKIFEWLNVESVVISTYGLRYGTLLEGILKDEFRFK